MRQRKGFHRALSLICVLCMMLSLFGGNVYAASTENVKNERDVETQTAAEGSTTDGLEAKPEGTTAEGTTAEGATSEK